jgi:hypothetical protein
MNLTLRPGAFAENSAECWKVYKEVSAEVVKQNRVVEKNDPFIGITEHDLSATEKVLVLVNYSTTDRTVQLYFKNGWTVKKSLYGALPVKSSIGIKANDAAVLILNKQ